MQARPLVMGVLNVTPDSFFDGGRYFDRDAAIARGRQMVAEGADVIDVGGESTRPGADPVDEAEELRRVLPVVAALAKLARVSIDTMKPSVAAAAVDAGATLVNDVSASLASVAAAAGVGLVVMHMQGTPKTMQDDPRYEDVVREVHGALRAGAAAARAAGVEEVYVDPGIGFGKTLEHNLALLGALPELVAAGEPVLVGTSRKSFIGRVLAPPGAAPLPPAERFEGSLASAVWAMAAGVAMVRVHDVAPTVHAARLVGRAARRLGAARR
ncbi:MAG TPA: dihydropteroate synthase [Acidimicrobiales bacterium]|nr:dihydropteroate synthase [Acidimicrobiales bacterium]